MRAAEVHLYAIIVLSLCHLDEAQWSNFQCVRLKAKSTEEDLSERDLSLDLGDTDAALSSAASRRPLDLTRRQAPSVLPVIESSCAWRSAPRKNWVCRHVCPRRRLGRCGAGPLLWEPHLQA